MRMVAHIADMFAEGAIYRYPTCTRRIRLIVAARNFEKTCGAGGRGLVSFGKSPDDYGAKPDETSQRNRASQNSQIGPQTHSLLFFSLA